jgi:hypothetical protein
MTKPSSSKEQEQDAEKKSWPNSFQVLNRRIEDEKE